LTKEKELMAGNTEAARKPGLSTEFAPLQFKDFATTVAAEVVMMGLTGDLIPQRFAGHGDRCEPITVQQRTDVAIHSGDTQTLDLSLRCAQYLFRRKRSIGLLKCLSDC
jgi:hypothetical protein